MLSAFVPEVIFSHSLITQLIFVFELKFLMGFSFAGFS